MDVTPRIRRCLHLYIEPWHQRSFSLESVLDGGTGMRAEHGWRALAPHLPGPVELTGTLLLRLDGIDPVQWAQPSLEVGDSDMQVLIQLGLVLEEGATCTAALADAQVRELDWWGPAAMMHWQSRWHGRDSAGALQAVGLQTAAGLRDRLGTPPPATLVPAGERVALPDIAPDPTDALLQLRSTCRNFDHARPLPLVIFSRMLLRCFAATGSYSLDDKSTFLKKNAPSAGGLHPTEAYLLVQNVQDVAPGLYHYHPQEHALTRLAGQGSFDPLLAVRLVAGQSWFGDAHVLVMLVSRFARTHWKYRNHAKAYRAAILDVGHLSQLLLGCATEQDLGAFVTAAINEADIEAELNLDTMAQGVLAVCGFGYRSMQMSTTEFDPGERIWERAPFG